MKPETFARIILFILLAAAGYVGTLAVGLGRKSVSAQAITLHARMPENGGWSVETIHAEAGQPIHLRMTSDDVMHSLAIGQSDTAPVEITPGEWSETTLVFDRPGRYVFYCTRWCGRNHWRMRGTIEVTGVSPTAEDTIQKPLYLQLGLNIDEMHMAENVPVGLPSSTRGTEIAAQLGSAQPTYLLDRETYRRTSPSDFWSRLRAETNLNDLSDAQVWDLVAYAWSHQTTPAAQAEAKQLYATNCAACHGEAGKGDGVIVEGLPAFDHTMGNHSLSKPPDLTDPASTLGASPALLEGKMLRGGMGTGMPYWGPIFTEEQIDALIAYIYGFVME